MNPILLLSTIEQLVDGADSYSQVEQLSAYSTARILINDLKEYNEKEKFDGYMNLYESFHVLEKHLAGVLNVCCEEGYTFREHAHYTCSSLSKLKMLIERNL